MQFRLRHLFYLTAIAAVVFWFLLTFPFAGLLLLFGLLILVFVFAYVAFLSFCETKIDEFLVRRRSRRSN